MARIASLLGVIGWGVMVLAGCESGASSASAYDANFRSLVTLYSSAVNYGQRPKSEAEFKTNIKSGRLAKVADALKVTDIDALFTSKRDGKPIVVIYGQRPAGMHPDVVAYEQEGVDGKRLVGFGLGTVDEVDEQRFRELVPASDAPR